MWRSPSAKPGGRPGKGHRCAAPMALQLIRRQVPATTITAAAQHQQQQKKTTKGELWVTRIDPASTHCRHSLQSSSWCVDDGNHVGSHSWRVTFACAFRIPTILPHLPRRAALGIGCWRINLRPIRPMPESINSAYTKSAYLSKRNRTSCESESGWKKHSSATVFSSARIDDANANQTKAFRSGRNR